MKYLICLVIYFVSYNSYAKSTDSDELTPAIEKLEKRILDEHALEVRSNDFHKYLKVAPPDYLAFLERFKAIAEDVDLGYLYFPVSIYLMVDNEDSIRNSQYRQENDIFFGRNFIRAGHGSARAAVLTLKNKFPRQGTSEASDLRKRSTAVRYAILDKIGLLQEKGITIRASDFKHLGGGEIENPGDIEYFRQEQLLQGLLNIESDVISGELTHKIVQLTNWDLFNHRKDDVYYYNHTFNLTDEWRLTRTIQEYIQLVE